MRGEVTTLTLCCLHSVFSQSLNKHCSVPGAREAEGGDRAEHTQHCRALGGAAAPNPAQPSVSQMSAGASHPEWEIQPGKEPECAASHSFTHSLGSSTLPPAWCGHKVITSAPSMDCRVWVLWPDAFRKALKTFPREMGRGQGLPKAVLQENQCFLSMAQSQCSTAAHLEQGNGLPSPHPALNSRSPSLADCHPRPFH